MKNILFIITVFVFTSCKKYLDVPQSRTQLSRAQIFENDATATAALLGIYAQMESSGLLYELSVYSGLSADEFRSHSTQTTYNDLFSNNLTPDNTLVYSAWTKLYRHVYQANAVLEGISMSTTLTPEIARQLMGEARFTRALCYYYLVSFFGEVPLARATDYEVNALLARSAVNDVLQFIEEDLDSARHMLPVQYKSGNNGTSTERVRPNKWAATALLARVYLHQQEFQLAETAASEVINAGIYSLPADLNSCFVKGSAEAIYQHMAVLPRYNSYAGGNFILAAAPSTISIRPDFLASFRPNDKRMLAWTKSISTPTGVFYFPYKYKVPQTVTATSEYTVILRLAEQYLIRSEARAMLDKLSESENDLSVIRMRAGLPALSGLSKMALLDSIDTERRFELMFETGERWINLKRRGTADAVLGALKGANWVSTDQLYPIPQMERLRNPNLTQNLGY